MGAVRGEAATRYMGVGRSRSTARAAGRALRVGLACLMGLTVLSVAGCESPRPPREAAAGSLAGAWAAESYASSAPSPGGRLAWEMSIEEREGGRLRGQGRTVGTGESADFAVTGLRARHTVKLDLRFRDGTMASFDGGSVDSRTLAGTLYLAEDTVEVTFTRRD